MKFELESSGLWLKPQDCVCQDFFTYMGLVVPLCVCVCLERFWVVQFGCSSPLAFNELGQHSRFQPLASHHIEIDHSFYWSVLHHSCISGWPFILLISAPSLMYQWLQRCWKNWVDGLDLWVEWDIEHLAVLIVIYEKNPKVYSFKLLNSDSLNIQQVQFSGTAVR